MVKIKSSDIPKKRNSYYAGSSHVTPHSEAGASKQLILFFHSTYTPNRFWRVKIKLWLHVKIKLWLQSFCSIGEPNGSILSSGDDVNFRVFLSNDFFANATLNSEPFNWEYLLFPLHSYHLTEMNFDWLICETENRIRQMY